VSFLQCFKDDGGFQSSVAESFHFFKESIGEFSIGCVGCGVQGKRVVVSWISDSKFPVVLLLLEMARGAEWAVDQAGNLGHSSITFTSVTFWVSSPK
jgi:hypothetical protein